MAHPSASAPCSATKSSTTCAPRPPVSSRTASTCPPSATTVWCAPIWPASFSASGLRSTTTIVVAVSAARHWTPIWPRPPAPITTAVVIGAGGLGHIGVQCLAALTATTIVVVDRNPDALKLAGQIGAHHTVVADGGQVEAVRELTGGRGAQVVLDFVAEQGAEADGWAMTGGGGSYFVIGYGGTVQVPTLDIISTERNIIGNIVGTYNDLAELMALAEGGRVTLHTRTYPLDAAADAFADLDAGRVRGRAILVP